MVAARRIADSEEGLIERGEGEDPALAVAAIYGANASGKSNVLEALAFMGSAVRDSHRKWAPEGPIPVQPFLLDEESRKKPSEFAIDFEVGGVRYQYGFSLSRERVESEWLWAYPAGKRQAWFTRGTGPIKFSSKLGGENRAIERLTRDNSLLLSAAAQNNHRELTPVYEWFAKGLRMLRADRTVDPLDLMQLVSERSRMERLGRFLETADVGVDGVKVQMLPLPAGADNANLVRDVTGEHMSIQFRHRVGSGGVYLPIEAESRGTIAYLSLFAPVVTGLSRGETVLVDELDASLHPMLGKEIVGFFSNGRSNRKKGQLIFSTHDTNLLSGGGLRRDQIWFTEKDRNGESHLYPLTDFKPRTGENLENGYLQGRYGAIPFPGPAPVFEAIEHGNEKDE